MKSRTLVLRSTAQSALHLKGVLPVALWIFGAVMNMAGGQVGAVAPRPAAHPVNASLPVRVIPSEPSLTYMNGQLQIDAPNTSLPTILNRVARVLGITIDIPPEMRNDLIPIAKYGPGPVREVLAALLTSSHWNFAIQDAENDTGNIQNVLLLGAKAAGNNDSDANGHGSHSPFLRAAGAPSSRPPVAEPVDPPSSPEVAAVAQGPQQTPAENTAAAPPPLPIAPSSEAVAAAMQALDGSPATIASAEDARTIHPSPPASLDPQSIGNQLQQMYQQRIQMTQQSRQTAVTVPPASSTTH